MFQFLVAFDWNSERWGVVLQEGKKGFLNKENSIYTKLETKGTNIKVQKLETNLVDLRDGQKFGMTKGWKGSVHHKRRWGKRVGWGYAAGDETLYMLIQEGHVDGLILLQNTLMAVFYYNTLLFLIDKKNEGHPGQRGLVGYSVMPQLRDCSSIPSQGAHLGCGFNPVFRCECLGPPYPDVCSFFHLGLHRKQPINASFSQQCFSLSPFLFL